MHFDDRLATVLRHRATGKATARIQFRQLLDLLGTLPVDATGQQFDEACDRLGELSKLIAANERAAMLREAGLRLRNPQLVALLAASDPSVAAAVIEHAQLSDDEWVDLVPALPIHARGMLRQRRSYSPTVEAAFDRLGMARRGIAHVSTQEAATPKVDPQRSPDEIGAIVRRIEDFRRSRLPGENGAPGKGMPAEHAIERPVTILPQAFDFATDPAGRIVWSDPGMAPMAVGLHLTTAESPAGQGLSTAIRLHQPVADISITLRGAPAIAGPWQLDAKPNFDAISGQLTGFSGRMRRTVDAALKPASPATDSSEADRMRQVLHELRTPVGAIQGFAEVIQQQVFGHAPHEYRALAASIAADAARILAGFEELERLARLESGIAEAEPGHCDLGLIVTQTIAQLRHFTDARSGGFAVACDPQAELTVALSHGATERLVWRLLGTIAGSVRPGEQVALQMNRDNQLVHLRIATPVSLVDIPLSTGTAPATVDTAKALSTGMFGTRFTLRLAKAEATAARGSLKLSEKALELTLPALTEAYLGNSNDPAAKAALG